MPNGGTLTITGAAGTLRFADTGAGFSPTALARATELFYTEREGGMGVGLNVAREIIHAHSGTLTLGNQPTGGATVCLTLPLAS
jgi:signal transduction histidine kinase